MQRLTLVLAGVLLLAGPGRGQENSKGAGNGTASAAGQTFQTGAAGGALGEAANKAKAEPSTEDTARQFAEDLGTAKKIESRVSQISDPSYLRGLSAGQRQKAQQEILDMVGKFNRQDTAALALDKVKPALEKLRDSADDPAMKPSHADPREGAPVPSAGGDLKPVISFGNDVQNAFYDREKVLAPNNPDVWARSGENFNAQRRYGPAFRDYGRTIELGRHDAKIWTGYGTAAFHLGDTRLAYQSAATALQLNPSDRAALALLRLSEGRPPQVHLPSALLGAGQGGENLSAAVGPGAAEGSAAVTAKAAMTPAEVAAEAQRQANAPASAVQQSAGVAAQAAEALTVRDYTQARDLASHAIELDGRNAQAWNYRAIADNKLGSYGDAIHDASFALGLAPGNAAALQTRSWAFSRTGQFRSALADANYSLEKDPGNAYAYYNRAFATAGLGDKEEAVGSLQRAAQLDRRFQPTYDQAVQAPKDSDLLFLFNDVGAQAAAPAPAAGDRKQRFLRLMLISILGGALVALGLLHTFSPRWRETVRATVRRVMGGGPAVTSQAEPDEGFWSGYTVNREIGSGGMGVVYEANDNALARRVAIKKMRDEIRRDPAERRRFLAEARTVAALHHPNIVDIYSIVEDAGDVYLVFEYVDGRTIAEMVKEQGGLPFAEARRIIGEACAAVAYAHQRGVIHRDLKLSNVMLAADGRVKVMDFGVARMAKEAVTKLARTNTIVGTPPYMAPEAEQGTVRRESDIFALGVCFYEMLSAKFPFAGEGAGMLLNKMNGKHEPLSRLLAGLPAGIDAVMARALAPDPEQRFHAPEEFASALQGLAS